MPLSNRAGRRLIATLAIVLTLGIIIASRASNNSASSTTAVSAAPRTNPIIEENSKPGTDAWKSKNFDSYLQNLSDQERLEHAQANNAASDAGGGNAAPAMWTDTQQLKGYASRQSVNLGETITFHVSAKTPTYNLSVIRMGWYDGNGGRWMMGQNDLPGTDYGIPAPDPTTGLIEANWPVAYSLTVPTDWVSGVYLVWLQTPDYSATSYIIFVVRNDSQVADILYQIPFNTYQAYNEWGGKSLYDYNSDGGRAYKVSFNRPYAQNDGSGLWYGGDYDMVRWLEMNGYNVTYAASEDLQTNPNLMNGRKMFMTNFHDEYYSWHMVDNLDSIRDSGKNMAFFASNNIYWQIRFEPSPITGAPDRTIVCYKKETDDPNSTHDPMLNSSTPQYTTVLFKDAPVNRPESHVLSTLFENAVGYGIAFDWVVKNADHWIYQGTGLNNNDVIPKLVGYEWDRLPIGQPVPSNVTMLSQSPVQGPPYNWVQEAAITTYPSGATVFTASTNYWAYTLMGNWFWPVDTRVRQMTANLIAHMTGASTPATSTPTNTVAASNTPTVAFTSTSTYTPSATMTNTAAPSSTFTFTPSRTYTPSRTNTGTVAPTNTPSRTNTATNTATRTNTAAPSNTPSRTNTPTITSTNTAAPSNTPSRTNTATNTATRTNTAAPSNTPSRTNTPTATRTNTAAPTNTPSRTSTATNTATRTNTAVPTNTPTRTPTAIPPTSTPVPTNTPPAGGTFYRAINLSGSGLTIDGNQWQGDNEVNFSKSGVSNTYCNQSVTLLPSTDANRSQMIRCSVYGSNANVTMYNVPNGQYQVYVYIWENDSTSSSYTIKVDNQTVATGTTGQRGWWRKLGPFNANIADNNITITGVATQMSGIELRQLSVVQPTATSVPRGTFYRGISVNGPITYINGEWWEGTTTGDSGITASGNWTTFCNQSIDLTPSEDWLTENMIRCSVSGRNFTLTMNNIPNRTYDVYLWVWEDGNTPSTYTISMQSGQAVRPNYNSGVKGHWDRLGPFTVNVTNGKITINITGDTANISGIELWRR